MWIKKAAIISCLLLGTASVTQMASAAVTQASTIDNKAPYKMMHQIADNLFSHMKSKQAEIEKDPNLLKEIVDTELMPYVNYQYAALKLLGPNLKGADKTEVKEFILQFREYLIASYAQVLTQYSDQEIVFSNEQPIPEGSRIISIPVTIVDSGQPDIKLSFTLIQSKKGDWKAYDMIAEGVSLLSSKQSEWSTTIRQNGIASMTKEITKLANKDTTLERNK